MGSINISATSSPSLKIQKKKLMQYPLRLNTTKTDWWFSMNVLLFKSGSNRQRFQRRRRKRRRRRKKTKRLTLLSLKHLLLKRWNLKKSNSRLKRQKKKNTPKSNLTAILLMSSLLKILRISLLLNPPCLTKTDWSSRLTNARINWSQCSTAGSKNCRELIRTSLSQKIFHPLSSFLKIKTNGFTARAKTLLEEFTPKESLQLKIKLAISLNDTITSKPQFMNSKCLKTVLNSTWISSTLWYFCFNLG